MRAGFAARILLAILLTVCAFPAPAVEPDEILADRALEARAREISAGLRCLVCQNQSIDDSNAPLARDLRLLVRERLKQGDEDDAVRSFIVQRYGEFVLLRPPLSARTVLLWATPLLLLLVVAGTLWSGLRSAQNGARGSSATPRLTPAEEDQLASLMREKK